MLGKFCNHHDLDIETKKAESALFFVNHNAKAKREEENKAINWDDVKKKSSYSPEEMLELPVDVLNQMLGVIGVDKTLFFESVEAAKDSYDGYLSKKAGSHVKVRTISSCLSFLSLIRSNTLVS
jgi:hypothetical protein